MDAAALGYLMKRRRTPGLRREEVAQRAHVSTTWYTWLEQGRGGSPSTEVLEDIAQALILSEAEREHLLLLAQHRPPTVQYQAFPEITERLQHVLDAFETSPAYIRNYEWDLLAWNHASTVIFGDLMDVSGTPQNVLEMLFANAKMRAGIPRWEHAARAIVSAFRLETLRAGASERIEARVKSWMETLPEFRKLWSELEVDAPCDAIRNVENPVFGNLQFEYSAFAVDGKPHLSMVVFTPATAQDKHTLRAMMSDHRSTAPTPHPKP